MAKKSFHQQIEQMLIQVQTPQEEKKPRKVGRPKVRRATTSQAGLPVGETRMTSIVRIELRDKLKFISFRESLSIKEILDEAITDYINKYEQMFGEIDLNHLNGKIK